jgi:hypothetical protein
VHVRVRGLEGEKRGVDRGEPLAVTVGGHARQPGPSRAGCERLPPQGRGPTPRSGGAEAAAAGRRRANCPQNANEAGRWAPGLVTAVD